MTSIPTNNIINTDLKANEHPYASYSSSSSRNGIGYNNAETHCIKLVRKKKKGIFCITCKQHFQALDLVISTIGHHKCDISNNRILSLKYKKLQFKQNYNDDTTMTVTVYSRLEFL
jgi:hypothetical protein